MSDGGQEQNIDFTMDKDNLYREESVTDLKAGSIRRLLPIKSDGADDPSRTPIFVGHAQLMSEKGPLPVQSRLSANTLEEAIDAFPEAINSALAEIIERVRQMQQQQQPGQQNDGSSIIIPGK